MIEAMKQALEALEKHAELGLLAGATITAIKEVLAQPEQEPDYYGLTSDHLWMSITKDHYNKLKPEFRMACYTTPPQRTWVGLTEQEHTDIAVECGCISADWVFYGATVERKLKEKNS